MPVEKLTMCASYLKLVSNRELADIAYAIGGVITTKNMNGVFDRFKVAMMSEERYSFKRITGLHYYMTYVALLVGEVRLESVKDIDGREIPVHTQAYELSL